MDPGPGLKTAVVGVVTRLLVTAVMVPAGGLDASPAVGGPASSARVRPSTGKASPEWSVAQRRPTWRCCPRDRSGTTLTKARAWLLQKRLVTLPVVIAARGLSIQPPRAPRGAPGARAPRTTAPPCLTTPVETLRRDDPGCGSGWGWTSTGGGRARAGRRGADAAVGTCSTSSTRPRSRGCGRGSRPAGGAATPSSTVRRTARPAWCAMSICGNRTKNRALRRRHARTQAVNDPELIGRRRDERGSLPLDRAGRLRRDVEATRLTPRDLVDDPARRSARAGRTGSRAQSAVIASSEVTARITIG